MTGPRFRRRLPLAFVALMLLVSAAAISAPAQTTEEELNRVEAELARIQAEVQQLTDEYQAAWAAEAELEFRISSLESSITAYGIEKRRLQDQIRERAVDLYMSGAAGNDLAALMIAASLSDIDIRTEYLDDAREQDQVLFNGLEILTRQLEEAAETLRLSRREQQEVLARLEELSIGLNERLAAGQEAYLRLEERRAEEIALAEAEARARAEAEAEARAQAEAEARAQAEAEAAFLATSTTTTTATTTTAPATTTTTEAATTTTTEQIAVTDTTLPNPTADPPDGPVTPADPGGAMACPVDGFHSFSDTWGAPRSGGRRHEGVDMLADRGTPVVAVEDGTIHRMSNTSRGGIAVWLDGIGGDRYYYAHLDAWAAGLAVGQMVSRGEQIGTVGTTGNAPAHIPHLHWEFHPDRGGPVNPTPLARELCG
ncbi:peptidoglycan DD-metalloendopeptidase family protein [Candidatus Spongiisocius sp.]|uniref:peptidoglycan DD-metalloendopeptidase family protein n=1 Tax=Candidatus Spongiisocius sp. TaxID=3101273 RepID=UPI003B5AAB1A